MTTETFSCGCCASDCLTIEIIPQLDTNSELQYRKKAYLDGTLIDDSIRSPNYLSNITCSPEEGTKCTPKNIVHFSFKGTYTYNGKTYYLCDGSNPDGGYAYEVDITCPELNTSYDTDFDAFVQETCRTTACSES